jgi:Flp pilus assembly protein TadG
MKKIIKQFLKRNDGVTAIEFAFFAIPFSFLLIGLVEVGMMSTAGATLQGATDEAARLIRTGQAQKSGDAQTLFEEKLCEKTDLIINCDNLVYEVIKVGDGTGFGGLSENMASIEPIYDLNGVLQPRGFDPGAENSLVVVRVTYNYPLLTPFVGPFLSDEGRNTRRLMSTAIIQNEPYDF